MIIQDKRTSISIPKEYMSYYNSATQNRNAYPPYEWDYATTTFTQYESTHYDSTEGEKEPVYDKYGLYHGVGQHLTGNYTYVVDAACERYGGTALERVGGFYGWRTVTTTDSTTGVTTEKYARVLLNGFSGILQTFVVQNPLLVMTTDYPSLTYLKFDFPNTGSYSGTLVSYITAGTSKTTKTWNIYVDHVALKDAIAAKADQYTIINLYHLDGTEWS